MVKPVLARKSTLVMAPGMARHTSQKNNSPARFRNRCGPFATLLATASEVPCETEKVATRISPVDRIPVLRSTEHGIMLVRQTRTVLESQVASSLVPHFRPGWLLSFERCGQDDEGAHVCQWAMCETMQSA